MSLCSRTMLVALAVCCLGFTALRADEILEVTPPPAPEPTVTITFTCPAAGFLFLPGQPIELTAHINNPLAEQEATVGITVQSVFGPVIYTDKRYIDLPRNGSVQEKIAIPPSKRLPKGSYLVTVLVTGERMITYSATRVSVWGGPATAANPAFGISYQGELDSKRALSDLDIFKMLGVSAVRFPFSGWLPQGEAMLTQATRYNNFAREVSLRGMSPLAAFTPLVTVDPAVNSAQAERDYHESLLSAAAHCGDGIKMWELLRVPPPAFPPNLKGIDYLITSKGREALRRFDKSLQVVFPTSDMVSDSMLLSAMALPAKDDIVGIHYNYQAIPEWDQVSPRPPTFTLLEATNFFRAKLKRTPTLWATNYGFDPEKKSNLPPDILQATYLARVLVMNRIAGINRTFWRHNTADPYDLPLTDAHGSALPSLLAVRTTLEKLDGVTEVKELHASAQTGVHLYLLRYGKIDKRTRNAGGNVLVAWCDREFNRVAMAVKTNAAQATLTDLWGNTLDLFPKDGTVIMQVDEFPRFVDLGAEGRLELHNASGAGGFEAPIKWISPASARHVAFAFRNDQMLFRGKIAGELILNAWPLSEEIVTTKFSLDAFANDSLTIPLTLPETKQSGRRFCEVSAQIIIGGRRVGYLTLPVYYTSQTPNE